MSAAEAFVSRLRHHQGARLQFARYLAIGGFVFILDVGSFKLLYARGVVLSAATALSYLLAVTTHFTLNRLYNFRNFDRSLYRQARTYAVVAAFCGVIQLGLVEGLFRLLHMDATAAKAIGVIVNIPIGFLGHRYLTFGHGIGGAIRKLRA
jgi:putative flippase GtrA